MPEPPSPRRPPSMAARVARNRANSPCRPRRGGGSAPWGAWGTTCGGGGAGGGAKEGATAPPPGFKERIRLLVRLLALVSASLRTAKIRVVKDWGERGGWAALSTGTLFGTDYDHHADPPILRRAVRSFFVLMLCGPSVNRKREQNKINGTPSRLEHIFSPANSTASQHLSASGTLNAPSHARRALRGSIHTVSLKCAQSCPRDDQIARRAVAPAPNRRHYDFDTWITPTGSSFAL